MSIPVSFSHEENFPKIETKAISSPEVFKSLLLKSDRHSLFHKQKKLLLFLNSLSLPFSSTCSQRFKFFEHLELLQGNLLYLPSAMFESTICIVSSFLRRGHLLIGFSRNALTPLKQFMWLTCMFFLFHFAVTRNHGW